MEASEARSTGLPPAGWYPDPDDPKAAQRYWDGELWTEARAPYAEPPGSDGVAVALGYLTSWIPFIGLAFGAYLLGRRNPHGKWVLGASLVFTLGVMAIGIADDS